jgi:CMP/dCMP kinase
MIIVIDGPAGSGKSSSARAIANRLNIQFLDSGALYRAVTWYWVQSQKPDFETFFKNLPETELETEYRDQTFFVSVNNKDITAEIRKHNVAKHVSKIASHPKIREFVNNYMRELVKEDVYVADGRDLGTAVFPDAELKFYMEASIKERAMRRFKELQQSDPGVTLQQVKENLEQRDHSDQTRAADPLKKADDAIVIDTTGKTFEEQIEEMIKIIEEQLKLKH